MSSKDAWKSHGKANLYLCFISTWSQVIVSLIDHITLKLYANSCSRFLQVDNIYGLLCDHMQFLWPSASYHPRCICYVPLVYSEMPWFIPISTCHPEYERALPWRYWRRFTTHEWQHLHHLQRRHADYSDGSRPAGGRSEWARAT